jgi:DNA-binding transcriptional ArsR family regulator
MPNKYQGLDRVFYALADPTRRAVLERLSHSPAPVSELAKPFDMALPSFIQHLGILERHGLVRSQKSGRIRTYQLAPQPLLAAEHWMAAQRAIWQTRFDQLDTYLNTPKEAKP